jgi:hypothetical protein
MNSERRTILALIAMGRITPAQAERLLGSLNEGRETAWILVLCLAYASLAQFHLHEWMPGILHFLHTRAPAMAEVVHQGFSRVTDLMPLTRIGGLL